jgi:hypothetical protein
MERGRRPSGRRPSLSCCFSGHQFRTSEFIIRRTRSGTDPGRRDSARRQSYSVSPRHVVVEEKGAERDPTDKTVTPAGWRLLAGRPRGVPDPAFARRRIVSGRDVSCTPVDSAVLTSRPAVIHDHHAPVRAPRYRQATDRARAAPAEHHRGTQQPDHVSHFHLIVSKPTSTRDTGGSRRSFRPQPPRPSRRRSAARFLASRQ